ncbi:MAG: TatD family hydrolase [Tenericutes bacterium]|nr:TatD family hydrolase [Mycoplasmatota bacterium]
MFIDTHCHLSSSDYDDIDLVINENRKAGMEKIIVSACDKKDFEEAFLLSEKYKDVFLTIGYHPEYVDDIVPADIAELDVLLKKEKVVGVGEIGLDYHYTKDNREAQIALFEQQLALAEKNNMPVVIHSRDATEDTINTLKKYKVKGVIHCFSGSLEVAEIYIRMGFKLGFGGVVTFSNSNLYKVVEKIGLPNIVLETDSPYLAPVPYRGKQNSSKYVPVIAQKIADILGLSLEEVASVTTSNACELFDLK